MYSSKSPKSKKFKCGVYDGEGRYEKNLIKLVGEKYKHFTFTNNIKLANILWYGKPFFDTDIELGLKIKGYINRVPGGKLFGDKKTQGMILNQLKELFPEEYSFHPQTFCLPRDTDIMQASMKKHPKKLLIAKPSEGGGGGGIYLLKAMKDLSGMTWASDGVVQSYVANPLLINNKKWDMRVYVLIHGINPMKAYISTDYGLARFCTEDYDTSDPNNIFKHLTNYSLNKNSEGYVKDQVYDEESKENNSKISLKEVWKLIKKNYPDVDIDTDCKQKMRDGVVNVLSATRSTIELYFLELTKFKEVKHSNKFYQILGFDIMFDDKFDAHLFEVNGHPSMDIFYHKDMADGTYNKDTSEIDERVKSMVFAEAAKVVITKKESEVFEHIYDSTEQGSFSSLYESVFEIYKKLSGIRLCSNISISKFSKLATYLPKSLKITKIDLELMFKKLQYDETSVIGLITFFTAMVKIAKKYEYNPESLIEETYSNILS